MGLFQDVKNTTFLHQQLLDGNGDFEYAFIDAEVVSKIFLILDQVSGMWGWISSWFFFIDEFRFYEGEGVLV